MGLGLAVKMYLFGAWDHLRIVNIPREEPPIRKTHKKFFILVSDYLKSKIEA